MKRVQKTSGSIRPQSYQHARAAASLLLSQKKKAFKKTHKQPKKLIHLDFDQFDIENGKIGFDLNENLDLSNMYDKYKVCLTKLVLPPISNNVGIKTLRVYCDLAEDGNTRQKIKEFVYEHKNEFEFQNLQFFPINKSNISSINFKITDQSEKIINFEKGYFQISIVIEQ